MNIRSAKFKSKLLKNIKNVKNDVIKAMRKILVVGGSIGGVTAAVYAATFMKNGDVTVISEEHPPLYRRPSIISLLKNPQIPINEIRWAIKTPKNVKILQGVKAESVNVYDMTAKLINTTSGKKFTLRWNSLILATGSSPILPEVEGNDLKGVYVLRSLRDVIEFNKRVKSGDSCVIVGGGFTALLIADALLKRGIKPVLVVRSRLLRKIIDTDMAENLHEVISRKCTIVYGNVDKIVGSAKVKSVLLNGGEKVKASIVIFATGTRPRIELAKQAGIFVTNDGIIVDEKMSTSIPYVYAVGDCAASLDPILRKHVYTPLGSKAALEGKIAGCNVAGKEQVNNGFVRSQFERVFNVDIISIGITYEEARSAGINAKIFDFPLKNNGKDRAKIILDEKDRIIGFQAIKTFPSYIFNFFQEMTKVVDVRKKALQLIKQILTGASFD